MITQGIDDATGKRLSTRQLLKKVPNVPCLYRHKLNLRYYGIKSVRGKLISEALRTEHGEPITDRKIAERRLKEWVESVEGERVRPALRRPWRRFLNATARPRRA